MRAAALAWLLVVTITEETAPNIPAFPAGPVRGARVFATVRRRLRPPWVVAAVLIIGFAITAVMTIAARTTYVHDEQSLVTSQTKLAAAALSVAPVDVERRLGRALTLVAGSGDQTAFGPSIRASMTPAGPFLSVGLFTGANGEPQMTSHLGEAPLASDAARTQAVLRALKSPGEGLVVTWIQAAGQQGFGYAIASSGPGGTYVGYAEQALPAQHYAPLPGNSPASKLWYAVYFGETLNQSSLILTNNKRLPLRGVVARAPVPFGDASLTLVASPREPLVGPFSVNLWWGIAVVGGLLTLLAAAVTQRLNHRRLIAESARAELSRAYAQQRDVAETLQRALLPQRLPVVPGLDIEGRYLPGMAGVHVGGDWYDAVALDEDHLFFSVGDVAGRGLRAAVLMSGLRNATAAYLAEDRGPSELLSALSRLLQKRGTEEMAEQFATMVCGLLDVTTGEVTIANAGHPPLVLVTEGRTEAVAATPGAPVGIGTDYPVTRLTLSPDAILIGYTDGLIERRGESLDEGLARLLAACAHKAPLKRLLADVEQAMVEAAGTKDDVALLGIHYFARSGAKEERQATATAASPSDPSSDPITWR